MDVQFFDSAPQPKEQVRIEALTATPYLDRFRVYIEVRVTPFRERPNLILALRNAEGSVINDLSIIETMHASMEFTMHIRGTDDPAGEYELTADLFYETKNPPQDRKTVTLTIPEAGA